jgi:hypothetical protein
MKSGSGWVAIGYVFVCLAVFGIWVVIVTRLYPAHTLGSY